MRASTGQLAAIPAARALGRQSCSGFCLARWAQFRLNRMMSRRDGCSLERLAGTAPFFGIRPIVVRVRSRNTL
eukprot:3690453-Prymnesium_polylepis.1